jgi:hypothetical protein
MLLKVWEDIGIVSSVALAAHYLAKQSTGLLANESVTGGIHNAIEELHGIEAVTDLVARQALTYQGTGRVAAAFAGQAQGPATLIAPLSKKGIQVLEAALQTWTPWKKIAETSSFWVISGEWTWNVLAHLAKDQPLADDLIWGGIRGAIGGACTGAKMGGEQWKTQMALGAVTGFGSGIVSSAVGSLAGKTIRRVFKILGHTIEDRSIARVAGVGATLLWGGPILNRPLGEALGAGIATTVTFDLLRK